MPWQELCSGAFVVLKTSLNAVLMPAETLRDFTQQRRACRAVFSINQNVTWLNTWSNTNFLLIKSMEFCCCCCCRVHWDSVMWKHSSCRRRADPGPVNGLSLWGCSLRTDVHLQDCWPGIKGPPGGGGCWSFTWTFIFFMFPLAASSQTPDQCAVHNLCKDEIKSNTVRRIVTFTTNLTNR